VRVMEIDETGHSGAMEIDEPGRGVWAGALIDETLRRQKFIEFLQHGNGELAADAVSSFIKFCFEMDAVLDTTSSPERRAIGDTSQPEAMRFVKTGCGQLLKNIFVASEPNGYDWN
jgi:hypothetical protein